MPNLPRNSFSMIQGAGAAQSAPAYRATVGNRLQPVVPGASETGVRLGADLATLPVRWTDRDIVEAQMARERARMDETHDRMAYNHARMINDPHAPHNALRSRMHGGHQLPVTMLPRIAPQCHIPAKFTAPLDDQSAGLVQDPRWVMAYRELAADNLVEEIGGVAAGAVNQIGTIGEAHYYVNWTCNGDPIPHWPGNYADGLDAYTVPTGRHLKSTAPYHSMW